MKRTRAVSRRRAIVGMLAVASGIWGTYLAAKQAGANAAPPAGVLKAADMANLMPAQVFFRGQSATVQMRNSGGIRYADGTLTLTALVDTSGYSSGIQQRYQAYLITEVPLELGDGTAAKQLTPGAYGVGFIQNDRFVVMDLGAHEVVNVGSHHDAELHRPMPLQVLDTPSAGVYRLYEGRSYVTVQRAR